MPVGISKVIAMRLKIVPGHFFVVFSALWLNLCNNSDQTLFSNALTLMHGKTCLIPILSDYLFFHLSFTCSRVSVHALREVTGRTDLYLVGCFQKHS